MDTSAVLPSLFRGRQLSREEFTSLLFRPLKLGATLKGMNLFFPIKVVLYKNGSKTFPCQSYFLLKVYSFPWSYNGIDLPL